MTTKCCNCANDMMPVYHCGCECHAWASQRIVEDEAAVTFECIICEHTFDFCDAHKNDDPPIARMPVCIQCAKGQQVLFDLQEAQYQVSPENY